MSRNFELGSVGRVGILIHSLAVLLSIAPIVAFFAPKGLAPIIILSACVGLLINWRAALLFAHSAWPVAIIFLAMSIWMMVSAAWSLDVQSAVIGSLKFAGNHLAGLILLSSILGLPDKYQHRLVCWSAIGWVVALFMVVSELLTGGIYYGRIVEGDFAFFSQVGVGQFWLNGVVVVLIAAICPVMVLSLKWYRPLATVGVLLAMAIVMVTIKFWAGVVAVVLGSIVGAAALANRRLVVGAVLLAVVFLSFSAPYLGGRANELTRMGRVMEFSMQNFQHRLGIWSFTSEQIASYPLRGWGMNASKHIPGGDTILQRPDGVKIGPALPLHPHNGILQIWLELGVVGLLLFLALFSAVVLAIIRKIQNPAIGAICLGLLVAGFIVGNLSFGMWQAWWIASLWLAAATAAMTKNLWADAEAESPRRQTIYRNRRSDFGD